MLYRVVGRGDELLTLIEIVKKREDYKENSNKGLVILLNGGWGTGKTTLLNDFISQIEEYSDMEIFNNYNAYKFDYYENAYIPFFSSIEDKIKLFAQFPDFLKSVGGVVSKSSVVLAFSVVKGILRKNFGIDLEELKDNFKDVIEENGKDYLKYFHDVDRYKEYIQTKVEELSRDKVQIFIIDELDRCKPEFALDTLEIVKHFFDIKNCVFIISVDKLQLENSIQTLYGSIDGEKYFSKLFDYQFNLFPMRFYELFDVGYHKKEIRELAYFVTDLYEILGISLRDGKKIFNDIIRKCNDWTVEQRKFMIFLFILKYTDLSFYNAIMNKHYDRYRKLILDEYSEYLDKYKRLLSKKISFEGVTYGQFLDIINHNLYRKLSDLLVDDSRTLYSVGSQTYTTAAMATEIVNYVPMVENETIKNAIEIIVG